MQPWIKNNQILVAVIALIVAFIVYTQFLSGPKNYEDCIFDVIKVAKTDKAYVGGRIACEERFPKVRAYAEPWKRFSKPSE